MTSLTLYVVSIAQTAKFLLTGSVPDVESDWTSICVKHQRVYLNTQCGYQIHSIMVYIHCVPKKNVTNKVPDHKLN